MKILFISPRFEGGIGGHARRIAEKLREEGIEIDMMNPTSIPVKKLKNPSFALIGAIKSKMMRKKYDIVHAFNVPSAFAMKYTNAKKRVLSIHGMYSDQVAALHSETTATTVKNFESKILKWADILTTDSKMVQKQYKEKLDLNFECLYAPLDIKKFKSIQDVSKNEKQIIYLGRDSYEKGIDVLKKIESQLDGKVVYCTNLKWEDAMIELKKSELLVIPSRMESIPQVIKEAFYLKIPIVATNVGGIPELIIHNETGLLVEPENEKELLDAINLILNDKKLAEKFVRNGYQFVMKNFTWEVLLPKYIQFYEKLIKS